MLIVIVTLLTVFQFQKIECGQGGIHMERNPLLCARLKVDESGKLFGIPKEKFDLKASGIIAIDGFSRQSGIRGKQERGEQFCPLAFTDVDQSERASDTLLTIAV